MLDNRIVGAQQVEHAELLYVLRQAYVSLRRQIGYFQSSLNDPVNDIFVAILGDFNVLGIRHCFQRGEGKMLCRFLSETMRVLPFLELGLHFRSLNSASNIPYRTIPPHLQVLLACIVLQRGFAHLLKYFKKYEFLN